MAQQKRRTQQKQKSDFPIFDYIDMVMPHKLFARFMEMPRHLRWTIISSIASLVLLIIFLRFVIGGLNYWIDTRGPFLNESYYLPYPLAERPLPVFPEVTPEDDRFLLLPQRIAENYVLQIPPTDEEMQAINQAELDEFLVLSLAAEESLTTLRESLSGMIVEPVETVVAEETNVEVVATPIANEEVALTPVVEVDALGTPIAVTEIVPTAAPTVDPILVQVMSIDGVLTPLVALNETLQDADSIEAAYVSAPVLRGQLHALEGTGINLPLEIPPFQERINELSEVEPATIYQSSECLMDSLYVEGAVEDPDEQRPCSIIRRALYLEQGDYVANNGAEFNIVVAEFPRPVDAAWAVKQLFYRARFVGATGDFALDDIIEYNYFFSQIDGVYTLGWSHENWVYSISTVSAVDIDSLMKVFPY